jgi:hypothetical protein
VKGFQIGVQDPGRLFPLDSEFIERGSLLPKNLIVPAAREKARIGAKEQASGTYNI